MSKFAMGKMLKNIVENLQDEKIPLMNFIITFLCAVNVRFFIEAFSMAQNYFSSSLDHVFAISIHYTLSYLTLALSFILFFHFSTRTAIQQVARVVLPSFIILLLGPLLDLLFTFGSGTNITYLHPGLAINLWQTYLTYFGGNFVGASMGLKWEIFIVLLGCFGYFRIKQQTLFYSVFYTWICYTIIFLWAASPYIIKWFLQMMGLTYAPSNQGATDFYLLTLFFLSLVVFYRANKKLFLILAQDLRIERILHYILMLVFGVVLALAVNGAELSSYLTANQEVIVHGALCGISIFFACVFAIITNNIADIEIDRISNVGRPLIRNQLDLSTYNAVAYSALILALFYAAMVNIKAFMLIGLTVSTYYIYSMPPLRLKRVTVISKLAISINSIALIILGYLLVQNSLNGFPRALLWTYLVGYTVAANFIDLKDVPGDRAAGIMTLPVLFKEEYAKIIIGAAFCFTYISFYFVIKSSSFLVLLIATGAVQFYLINKKDYREFPVFLLCNISIIVLIGYLVKYGIPVE